MVEGVIRPFYPAILVVVERFLGKVVACWEKFFELLGKGWSRFMKFCDFEKKFDSFLGHKSPGGRGGYPKKLRFLLMERAERLKDLVNKHRAESPTAVIIFAIVVVYSLGVVGVCLACYHGVDITMDEFMDAFNSYGG